MNVVVDASVIVKWIFQAPETEANTEQALDLLTAIRDGKVSLLQPLHWLVEVAAVVTRLRPELAESALDLLNAMEFPAVDDLPVLQRASRISRDLDHHLVRHALSRGRLGIWLHACHRGRQVLPEGAEPGTDRVA